MPLPSSGPLSISQIRNEQVNFGGFPSTYSLRQLSANAGFSIPDSISEFYGYNAGSVVQSGLTWWLDASEPSTATNTQWTNKVNSAQFGTPGTFNGGISPAIATSNAGTIRFYNYRGTTAPAAAFLGGGFHTLNVRPATDYSTTSIWFNNNTSSDKVMALGSTGWESTLFQGVELFLNGIAVGQMSGRITTSGTANSDLSSPYNYNQWYQLTQTFNGVTQALYVNGVLYTSKSLTGVQNKPNRDYLIGGSRQGNGNPQIFLNGAIGHYLIYNRALSAGEVLQNYNATKSKFGL
jgi:hypothetical protein